MRTMRFTQETARPIAHHDSEGFALSRLVRGTLDLHAHFCYLAPRGRIGRHEAASEQLLLVVDGEAVVRGGDGEEARLGAGEAVLFAPGEMHETVSESGMRALIMEADGISGVLG